MPGSRLIKFMATDGVRTYAAMEYESLKSVPEFAEGMLINLRPPFEVSRGVMLLKSCNVEVVLSPLPSHIEERKEIKAPSTEQKTVMHKQIKPQSKNSEDSFDLEDI